MAEAVRQLFARIAPRYDLLNRVLSGRLDVRWRRLAVAMLPPGDGLALDLACGTFDLGIEALHQGRCRRMHGCDFCLPMLQAGVAKRRAVGISATAGDALRLPYGDASFDVAMVAYGWRNFGDPAASARELRRVLRPGGHLLVLEFFRPITWWPRLFYGTFGRGVFPVMGALLARDANAYRYLHDSIRGFIGIDEAHQVLEQAGFAQVRHQAFVGGVSHALAAS